MFGQVIFALLLTIATVAMHVLGIVRVVLPIAGVLRDAGKLPHPPRRVGILTCLVSGLLFLHLLEMGLWAGAFAIVGVFPDFETALTAVRL